MTKNELWNMEICEPDRDIYRKAIQRFDTVCKPIDGLGEFERIIARIAAIQRTEKPFLSKKVLAILCADNGVVAEGVSQTEHSVTAKVARLMGERRSVAGIMLKPYGADSMVYDVGMKDEAVFDGVQDRKIARGTGNMAVEPAMTEEECLRAIRTGIDIAGELQEDYGLIATGEMGIGNTTTSTALISLLLSEGVTRIVGRGAGLTEERFERKIRVIEGSIRRAEQELSGIDDSRERAFQALRQLGGLDIAAMAGIFIGGAIHHRPVVIDGLISAAAAAVAAAMVPGTENYMLASHTGKEKGTKLVLDALGLTPVISAGLALGEGTGAILLFPLIDMAYSVYENGPFFQDAQMEAYKRNDE